VKEQVLITYNKASTNEIIKGTQLMKSWWCP